MESLSLWEQTYTGCCPVGSNHSVNEVEYVIRDIFCASDALIRGIHACVHHSLEVHESCMYEKYFIHVVVRGNGSSLSENSVNVSNSLHERTYSDFVEKPFPDYVRNVYGKLRDLFLKAMEGTAVVSILFQRNVENFVQRTILARSNDVSGCRLPTYVCEGYMRPHAFAMNRQSRRRKRDFGQFEFECSEEATNHIRQYIYVSD